MNNRSDAPKLLIPDILIGCKSTNLINNPPKLHINAATINIMWARDEFI